MKRHAKTRQPKWTPFQPASSTAESRERIKQALVLQDEELRLGELYVNSRYQVMVRRQHPAEGSGPPLVHLSIKRRDGQPIHDWRDLQRIKNELLSPEHEAVELYPAESRRVDAANQYHLWAIDDPGFRWPVGFHERLVSEEPKAGARQRPFEV